MSKDSDPDISDSDPDPGVFASDSDVCDHGEIQNGYYYEFCHICKKYFCENNDENHESCKKKKCTEKDFEETKMSETNIEKQLDELVNEKDVTGIHQEMYIKYVIFKLGSRQESRFSMWSPHCKNCGVLCPPNEQHTIGVISHRPLKVCLAHLIWCARS